MKTNGKFQFQAVVYLQIDNAQALHILSDPEPSKAMLDWLNRQGCELGEEPSNYNVEQLRKGHGQYLSDKAVEETKLLTVSTPCNL